MMAGSLAPGDLGNIQIRGELHAVPHRDAHVDLGVHLVTWSRIAKFREQTNSGKQDSESGHDLKRIARRFLKRRENSYPIGIQCIRMRGPTVCW
jgi:hypothetical protein